MLLTVNVGNTNVKFGVFEGSELRGVWRAATDRERTGDEWAVHLERFLAAEGCTISQITGFVACSVVPAITVALRQMAKRYLGVEPLFVSSAITLGLAIEYPRPEEIGPDRLVNAVAAVELYGAPSVIVDMGTATSVTVVNERGAFIGGIIAPGVETSLAALSQRAARLFHVDLEFPPHVIGTSTTEAMQSGLMWGGISLVEGIASRIHQELGAPCPVIATGGLAKLLISHTSVFTAVDPNLTLKGLQIVWQRNQHVAPDAPAL